MDNAGRGMTWQKKLLVNFRYDITNTHTLRLRDRKETI